MKPIALLIFLSFPFLTHAETTVSAMQDNHLLKISSSMKQQMEKLAPALLLSSDYEASQKIATEEKWHQAIKASHIHLVFSEPRIFSFQFSTTGPATLKDVSAQEIVVPISHDSAPDYIFVRSQDQIRAFAKYNDRDALLALQKLLPPRSNP